MKLQEIKNISPVLVKRPKICVLSIVCLIIICCQSCKKFIDIPPPTNQLVTVSTFNNDASATSAVIGIYTKMFSNDESFNISVSNGLLADELVPHVTTGTYFQYYTNTMTNSATVYGRWSTPYSYIYQANAVIGALQQYSGTSPAVKRQLLGEAYFIRAFWHFYLTDQYGAVPVALTTNYTVTDQLSRTPRVQVLQQVIADLNMAKGLLGDNYVDASDTTTTNDRVRPTKAVAEALLARVYLYLGDYSNNDANDYQNALSAASSVINNSSYALCPNLSGTNSVFLTNSTEAIWQLYTPLPSKYDTYDGNAYILLAAPSVSAPIRNNVISSQLLNAFEPGDQRKANWIGSLTIKGTTYYFPNKYKENTYTGQEYTMVLRLAEQYLIRAEANAELGNTSQALTDLNVIRSRAGLPAYAGTQDKASLLTAILHEREVELFTEWGHRWFDLARASANPNSTVNINTVMSMVAPFKGGTWNIDGHQALYPISLRDLQIDANLTQNTGY
jgi:starch-binding outer membrane protein, SusD/RagB family